MYVFGNGESRTSVNIDKLEGTKVGCNAIYRDYTMDHLICVDRRMVQEVLTNDANQHSYIYTRQDWLSQFNAVRVRTVPAGNCAACTQRRPFRRTGSGKTGPPSPTAARGSQSTPARHKP